MLTLADQRIIAEIVTQVAGFSVAFLIIAITVWKVCVNLLDDAIDLCEMLWKIRKAKKAKANEKLEENT